MKTFKKVKEGDCIYAVYDSGIVEQKIVKEKVEDWYEHMCYFYFDNGYVKVNMDMYAWHDEDEDFLTYYADVKNAIHHIDLIRIDAERTLKTCEESLKLFA